MPVASKLSDVSVRRRVKFAVSKIEQQFQSSPEHKLMRAITTQAVEDLDSDDQNDRRSAIVFLSGDMYPAALCNVNPAWIRSLLHSLKLLDFSKRGRA